jgi:hypothetical protein
MHQVLPCSSVGYTPSIRSAVTILLAEQKTQSSRFWPKELRDVCIFSRRTSFANENFLSAITREVCKYDPRGNYRKTHTAVQFTIRAISEASNTAKLNTEHTIVQGNVVVDDMTPKPSSVEPIQGDIDTSAALINDFKSLSDAWGPLLQKIKLFSALVDSIAEVRDRADSLDSIGSRRDLIRFTLTRRWRGTSSPLHTRHVLCMLQTLVI